MQLCIFYLLTVRRQGGKQGVFGRFCGRKHEFSCRRIEIAISQSETKKFIFRLSWVFLMMQ
jgi:hypothetical protein